LVSSQNARAAFTRLGQTGWRFSVASIARDPPRAVVPTNLGGVVFAAHGARQTGSTSLLFFDAKRSQCLTDFVDDPLPFGAASLQGDFVLTSLWITGITRGTGMRQLVADGRLTRAALQRAPFAVGVAHPRREFIKTASVTVVTLRFDVLGVRGASSNAPQVFVFSALSRVVVGQSRKGALRRREDKQARQKEPDSRALHLRNFPTR
jgi:hypothetical protein